MNIITKILYKQTTFQNESNINISYNSVHKAVHTKLNIITIVHKIKVMYYNLWNKKIVGFCLVNIVGGRLHYIVRIYNSCSH